MWIVCQLKADRSVEPTKTQGIWPNGSVMEGLEYPTIAVPNIEQYGTHDKRDGATKALTLMFYPELVDSDIKHIRRVCKALTTGSLKTHKIMKLENKNKNKNENTHAY